MKLNFNRCLHRLGCEIRRVRREPSVYASPDPREIAELERILKQFANGEPDSSGCANVKDLRSYLSDRRIAFFHDVIRLCSRHQVDLEAKRVADIGSGTGCLLRLIHQAAPTAELSGFDTFGEMMGLAAMLCPAADFEVRSLFQVSDKFDVIFCTEILEHLEQPGEALQAMARLVLPGGSLVLTVPDGRKDQQAPGQKRDDGSGYWGHIHFWSPESWRLFLERRLGPSHQIEWGQVVTGENYGIIHLRGGGTR